MDKQWFVLHTLTGQEVKVKAHLERRIQAEEMGDMIGEITIPCEKVSEVKRGKKTTATRLFYPGYVLIQIRLFNDDGQLNDKSWYYIRETPGVIGFVGGERPVPLRPSEVESIIHQISDQREKVKPKVAFEPGETVKINDGPFLNFSGVIEEVDPERGKLKVSVSIFGRTAPVELEYWQVERV
ncbi:MAG: transcription termination/antitermination factor NusG [Lentisphaerae bacterium]|nr:transcription termination/antitermination factor NusG [Lentisphaerota bacterium]